MKSPISDHHGQLSVWRDDKRFKVLVCGRRWGKTILANEWLLQGMNEPDSRNCYTAPTRLQAKSISWDYALKRCHELHWSIKPYKADLIIERKKNKSIYQIQSAEKEDRFRGYAYDRIVLDEFAVYKSMSIWTQCIRPTLSDRRGRAIFLYTPKGYGIGYDIFNTAQRDINWGFYKFSTMDSPFFQTDEGRAEIEEARRNLSERDFAQEYEAEFVSYSGRIYYAFDRQACDCNQRFEPSLPIILGQDFNRSPMASALYHQINGKLQQFGELFIETADTEITCSKIREIYGNHVKIIAYPDNTGVRRQTSSRGYSDFDIMKEYNIEVRAGSSNPRLVDRWAAVNRAYEKGLVKVNVNECPKTVRDRETMTYKEGECKPHLTDPYMGHMADAADYPIFAIFPIFNKINPRAGSYA